MALCVAHGPFELLGPWSAVFPDYKEAALSSLHWTALEAAKVMRRRGAGRIISCADWVAASGRPRYKDYIPYYTAKAGVIALTEALALSLAPAFMKAVVAYLDNSWEMNSGDVQAAVDALRPD